MFSTTMLLRYRSQQPDWRLRDRFILSKGHGCLALYAVLADKGFFPVSELATYCAADSRLGGHPETKVPGVEASTGALGHGLAIGVGMAIAARLDARDSRVFVVLGDGETNEGSVWESAMSAAKHKLANLVAIVDYNKFQSYGPTSEVLELEPLADKWRSFGFAVAEVDGHDVGRTARHVRRAAAGGTKAERRDLPHRQGQGHPVHRERRPLASQVEAQRRGDRGAVRRAGVKR